MPRAVVPGLKQHQLKTVQLRVPTPVWPQVSTGRVREFRADAGNNAPKLWQGPSPTLAVLYRKRVLKTYDYRLMVLERVRIEMLSAITDEGLGAAGYTGPDALARFRRDWMLQGKRRYEPLRKVFVYTVRPIDDLEGDDLDYLGRSLIDFLYGEYLDQGAHLRPKTCSAT